MMRPVSRSAGVQRQYREQLNCLPFFSDNNTTAHGPGQVTHSASLAPSLWFQFCHHQSGSRWAAL